MWGEGLEYVRTGYVRQWADTVWTEVLQCAGYCVVLAFKLV